MNPSTSFSTGMYVPPFGFSRKTKPKSAKVISSSKLYRSHSTNEGKGGKKTIDWKISEARPVSKRSQLTNFNTSLRLDNQMRGLSLRTTEPVRDNKIQDFTVKRRSRLVVTDLSSNNLERHNEKFFRPLTGREKQRRISVWVQNVERQRTGPGGGALSSCDTPSTETTGALSASLVSQQGSSGRQRGSAAATAHLSNC